MFSDRPIHCSSGLDVFCNVFVALRVVLSIPVSSLASKLKIIKNYLRSAISQQSLSGLAVLSMMTARIFARTIIITNHFAAAKLDKMLSYRRETALQGALQFSPKVEDWN